MSTHGALRLPLTKAVSLAASTNSFLQKTEKQTLNPHQQEDENSKRGQTGGFIKVRRGSPGNTLTNASGGRRPATQNVQARERGLPKNFILSSNGSLSKLRMSSPNINELKPQDSLHKGEFRFP